MRAAEVIEVCRIGALASVNPFEKLKLMADTFLSVKDLPGDVADLGAMRGGSALILRRLAPDKRLHVFDTWEGTPYDDPLCHHGKGEWAVSMEECQKLVGQEGPLLLYWKGVFPESAWFFRAGKDYDGDTGRYFCFVYVDMDTYQATHDAIEFFWPRVVPGGKLFFDDYGWEPCAGVAKAVGELFTKDMVTVVPSLYTCVVEKR